MSLQSTHVSFKLEPSRPVGNLFLMSYRFCEICFKTILLFWLVMSFPYGILFLLKANVEGVIFNW